MRIGFAVAFPNKSAPPCHDRQHTHECRQVPEDPSYGHSTRAMDQQVMVATTLCQYTPSQHQHMVSTTGWRLPAEPWGNRLPKRERTTSSHHTCIACQAACAIPAAVALGPGLHCGAERRKISRRRPSEGSKEMGPAPPPAYTVSPNRDMKRQGPATCVDKTPSSKSADSKEGRG